ncbi:uncharacterized protein LOC125519100 [Triticum urartu]|uniref:uncharacterized protein LOC125519100 n=1 Tax=Triticum urartu TaxID=4572 RepID=UPI002043A399|nr:uncharacterized protein LOC125519100 [Triticum urartu]
MGKTGRIRQADHPALTPPMSLQISDSDFSRLSLAPRLLHVVIHKNSPNHTAPRVKTKTTRCRTSPPVAPKERHFGGAPSPLCLLLELHGRLLPWRRFRNSVLSKHSGSPFPHCSHGAASSSSHSAGAQAVLEDARGVGDKSRGVAREEKDRVSVVLQEARAKRNAREYCRKIINNTSMNRRAFFIITAISVQQLINILHSGSCRGYFFLGSVGSMLWELEPSRGHWQV